MSVRRPAPPPLQLALPLSGVDGDGWSHRWRSRRPRWQHRHARPFHPDRFDVVALDDRPGVRAARRFTIRHHYAGAWLAARLCYGLIDRTPDLDDYPDPDPSDRIGGGRLVGVAVLSVPAHPAVLTRPFPGLTPYTEALDLGRFLILDPVAANAETWVLARVFKLARTVGVRGIVAFADPLPRHRGDGTLIKPAHLGAAYQAHNGVHVGASRAAPQILFPDGTSLPGRAASKLRGGEVGAGGVAARLLQRGAPPPQPGEPPERWFSRALEATGATVAEHPGKYKYAWSSGGRSARIAQTARPYPKAADLAALSTGGAR